MSQRRATKRRASRRNGPGAIPGVFLAKTPVDPKLDKQADDVMDLWETIERGAETSFQTADEKEDEARHQEQFFTLLAYKIAERCPWASGKARAAVTPTGYTVALRDREGRTYDIDVSYDYLADIALKHGLNGDLRPLCDGVVDELLKARDDYFRRRDAHLA